MIFSPGALVTARNRQWVVQPGSSEDIVYLRPFGTTDIEETALLAKQEKIETAEFSIPEFSDCGRFHDARLLRDAVRLSFRSGAGPFRSFGRIRLEPRPYQLVPLLMALKLNPVRMLIADDVGIGKTIEAALIARELLDRGEITRFSVLCPPHLAEQWQHELSEKFNIDAELVLSSTAAKLEKYRRFDESIFDRFPFTVVSLDFIKADARRAEFLRSAPELVIIDEAHACVSGYEGRGTKHRRHKLLMDLAEDPKRHILLVTAVPHSGNEQAFRALLALVHSAFKLLPADLSGKQNEHLRRELARYFIQRRRADIRTYLDSETFFPERLSKEAPYALSVPYNDFFKKVITFITETLPKSDLHEFKNRFRWWSALALLRCMASSPRAAAATLRSRAAFNDAATQDELDAAGRDSVFDTAVEESAESIDITPGADIDENHDPGFPRRKLREFALEAERLLPKDDKKLQMALTETKKLLAEGHSPIIFCRFIETAEYVAEYLSANLPNTEVRAVTGRLTPPEREEAVLSLTKSPKRVLAATDCLSEGINLQSGFNAVIHYDLAWNPSRHEQREGRVDRFGQVSKTVKMIMMYGKDNRIDGIVMNILIRKHDTIKTSLGYSVPVPIDSDSVIEAIFEGLLLKESAGAHSGQISLFEQEMHTSEKKFHNDWERAADREKTNRSLYAQKPIKPEEVFAELRAMRDAIGGEDDVCRFVTSVLNRNGCVVTPNTVYHIHAQEAKAAVRDILDGRKKLDVTFSLPAPEGVTYLHRTSPLVHLLAGHVLQTALDKDLESTAARAGVVRTSGVTRKTTLLFLRYRFELIRTEDGVSNTMLSEDSEIAAFRGRITAPEWMSAEETAHLLELQPEANVPQDIAEDEFIALHSHSEAVKDAADSFAKKRALEVLEAHKRVRAAANIKNVKYEVNPILPADIIGMYIFLPAVK